MIEKFNISNIDIEKLNMKIDAYRIKKFFKESEEEILLFMNRYTIAILMEQEDFVNYHSITGRVAKYRGYKVYQDDELEFGEVKII